MRAGGEPGNKAIYEATNMGECGYMCSMATHIS